MHYTILKVIFQIALRIFFKGFRVKNKSYIPKKGPMILVSNHPNTFMDPLVIASKVRPQVYFLANSSIFINKLVSWILHQLHLIPIKRKIDHSNQKVKVNNQAIFQKCYEFLGRKGTIIIFPEGESIGERRLRKLKTGTARIALGAEAAHNFELGLKIVTVGLNYSHPGQFRSDVFLNVDEPIEVTDYKELYQEDSFAAAKALTEKIREKLESHIINTRDQAEDNLALKIEQVYKPKLSDDIQLSPEKQEQEYLISKGIVEAIQHFEIHEPERLAQFQPKLDSYLNNLNRLHLSDEVFNNKKTSGGLLKSTLQTLLYLILGLPFFLYGWINNYLPYRIPGWIASKISRATHVVEYQAPVMLVTGIFTFIGFYSFQTILIHSIFQNGWLTLAYFLSLVPSGFFALFYGNYFLSIKDKWRLMALFYKRSDLVDQLIQQRKEIMQSLEQAKQDYLAYYQVPGSEI